MPRRKPTFALATTLALAAPFVSACERVQPPTPPPDDVLVTAVVQKDAPIASEWVGTTGDPTTLLAMRLPVAHDHHEADW
jgi:hypothetical protein